MIVCRSFGRKVRKEPLLATEAMRLAKELADERCAVRLLANGSAADYDDWIAVCFDSPSEPQAIRCADAFSKKITRLGAVLLRASEAVLAGVVVDLLQRLLSDGTCAIASWTSA
jgi:hypothetical protein